MQLTLVRGPVGGRPEMFAMPRSDYFFIMYDKERPADNRQRVAEDPGNTEPGKWAIFNGRGCIQQTGDGLFSAPRPPGALSTPEFFADRPPSATISA